jgi:hypothetical protein
MISNFINTYPRTDYAEGEKMPVPDKRDKKRSGRRDLNWSGGGHSNHDHTSREPYWKPPVWEHKSRERPAWEHKSAERPAWDHKSREKPRWEHKEPPRPQW